jgi:hypothetical protein
MTWNERTVLKEYSPDTSSLPSDVQGLSLPLLAVDSLNIKVFTHVVTSFVLGIQCAEMN